MMIPHQRKGPGFTIIEIVLSLAVLGLLLAGIFSIQRGAMDISIEVTSREAKTLRVHSFVELLRRTFEQTPGNAKVNLQFFGGAGSDLTEVAFTDYPLAFSWPGVVAGSRTVIFRTERSPGGGLQAVLLYLDEEQSRNWQENRLDESKISGRLILLDGISTLGWRFFNDQTQEWEVEWPVSNTTRPTFVEMTVLFTSRYGENTDSTRLNFWIPTMANPQQFTSFSNGGGGAGAGGAPGGTPGPGGNPPPGGPGGGGRPGGGGPGGGGRPGGGGGRPGGGGGGGPR